MSGLVVMSPSPKPIAPNPRPVDPGVSIGHVHLKVADLNRAIAFYCGVAENGPAPWDFAGADPDAW